VRNFLLRHSIAIQIGLAALMAAGGAAAGFPRSATVFAIAVVAGLIGIWELRSPQPPPSPRAIRRASKLLARNMNSRPSGSYVSPYVVTFDDEGVVVDVGRKKRESVLWAELMVVAITIEDGFLPLPYWILFGCPGRGGCMYPINAVGAREMLHELQTRLPDFDNRAVIKAMGMMSGGVHVWKHPDGKN
jgi:hypothetical protein